MDDVVQAGLLARGSSPFSAFPDLALRSPVAFRKKIHRRQLRGQLRLWPAEMASRTEFPFGRSTRPAHLNAINKMRAANCCQASRRHFDLARGDFVVAC